MVGSAAVTTLPSRNATPDPSTAAAMTQRPVVVPMRSVPGAGAAAAAAGGWVTARFWPFRSRSPNISPR